MLHLNCLPCLMLRVIVGNVFSMYGKYFSIISLTFTFPALHSLCTGVKLKETTKRRQTTDNMTHFCIFTQVFKTDAPQQLNNV